jgi:hypothetical protein
MVRRALIVVLGLPAALLALWGGWEIALQVPGAPQALVGAAGLLAIGVIALAATFLGATTTRG